MYIHNLAQLAGAVEYTNSNAGALGNVEFPFTVISLRSTLAWSGNTR